MIFFSCLSPQQSFLKRKRGRKQNGLSTRVQRPQASLFNLMLTAFDVVICHLLIGQHLPRLQKQRKKERKRSETASCDLHHFPSRLPERRKNWIPNQIPCSTAFFRLYFSAYRSTRTSAGFIYSILLKDALRYLNTSFIYVRCVNVTTNNWQLSHLAKQWHLLLHIFTVHVHIKCSLLSVWLWLAGCIVTDSLWRTCVLATNCHPP